MTLTLFQILVLYAVSIKLQRVEVIPPKNNRSQSRIFSYDLTQENFHEKSTF